MAMHRATAAAALLARRCLLPASPRVLCRQMSLEPQAAVSRIKEAGLLKTQGLIGGKWVDSYDRKIIEVHNPATGDVIAKIPCMGQKETADAISSAFSTFSCMR